MKIIVPLTTLMLWINIVTTEFYSLNSYVVWNFIHSQQLLSMLPILAMQMPPELNEYLRHVRNLANLDSHLMKYDYIFTFDWTLNPSVVDNL